MSNISRIKCRKESLPSPPATPKNTSEYDRRFSLPQNRIFSVSNLLESSSNCNKGSKQKHGPIFTSTPASAGGTFPSSSSGLETQTPIETTWVTCPEDVESGGIKRSPGFHDAELLEEQVLFVRLTFKSKITYYIR